MVHSLVGFARSSNKSYFERPRTSLKSTTYQNLRFIGVKKPVILYNAKILLFGEHTVIKGSQALAMPINDYYGQWKYATNKAEFKKLQYDLPIFQRYLEKQGLNQRINIAEFTFALQQGLYFDANIPTGYGVGSSGALCAAILDKFGKNNKALSLLELKQVFAQMESYFHGASSGTEP